MVLFHSIYVKNTTERTLFWKHIKTRANFPLPASPIQKECAEDLDMIWIKRILSLPALNSRKWNTASSSALAGNICFYSSLNTRLFPKSQEVDCLLRFLNLSQQSGRLYAGISGALARRPKSAPAPRDLEVPLEETQWDSTVSRAGGTELVGHTACPEAPRWQRAEWWARGSFAIWSQANAPACDLQGSRFHKVDSELHENLP